MLTGLLQLAYFTNVSTHISAEDIAVFGNQLKLRPLAAERSYEEELQVIMQVQLQVLSRAPHEIAIPDFESREPADLFRRGSGFCYDRSRTLDKVYSYLGFKARHVYILYRENLPFIRAIFNPKQSSHAVTEVKTSRGWLFVDSNSPWIAVTRDGVPVGADDVWRRINEFDNPPEHLRSPWWAIRGMYSRKGQLYSPYIFFPDINWDDLVHWLIED